MAPTDSSSQEELFPQPVLGDCGDEGKKSLYFSPRNLTKKGYTGHATFCKRQDESKG